MGRNCKPPSLQATRINVGWAKHRAKKNTTLIGCHANAKGTPATKGEQESAPTHLLEEEAVVEIVQDEAEAARTSADGRTGAIATRIVAVTGLSARRDVVPGGTGMRTCTWPMARGSNQLWRAMCRLHLPGVDWVCTSMTVEEIETDPTHLPEEVVVKIT